MALQLSGSTILINAVQLLYLVIDPALDALHMNSASARKLLHYTAACESNCGEYIKQFPSGPALGIFQMEVNTYYDLWDNYIKL